MQLQFFSIPVRYFLEVAEAGSVSGASRRLHVAASAVSRQIGKLEDALGLPLFERQASGMLPTEAGAGLLAHLRASHEEADRVARRLQGLAEQAAQQVRVACTEGFAAGLMPRVLQAFRSTHPQNLVELHVLPPAEVSARLQQGELDLGLKYCVEPEPGLAVLHSMRAPLYALMLPGHPLARQPKLSVADAVRHPLALGPRGMTGRQLFDMACSVQGLQYRTSFVSNSSSLLLAQLREDEIMIAGFHTGMHLVAAGQMVAVPFSDASMRQRMLQVLAVQDRPLPDLQQQFANALAEGLGQDGRQRKALRAARR
jgi:DNA-binding transcriptional LysR family regulator